jgi:amidophosphoribosyltransferase
MLRDAGAKEIHLRISSPPIAYSCHYGVSTPTRDNLLAAQNKLPAMADILGVDTLKFLSLESLKKVLEKGTRTKHCHACFNGLYPEEIFCKIPVAPAD